VRLSNDPASNGSAALHFEITDHGPGIPEQEQGHLFERFYRSPSVKNQVPGFGLGLAIASSIVQAHRGELTVSSRPGETTFRLTLPSPAPGSQLPGSQPPGSRAPVFEAPAPDRSGARL
jgi:signal transduction histidine kinase